MQSMVLAALLITAGLAQAKDPTMTFEEVQQVDDLPKHPVEATGVSESDAPMLSRKKRGIGPVVGMPCEPGYKLVGENCAMASVEFE